MVPTRSLYAPVLSHIVWSVITLLEELNVRVTIVDSDSVTFIVAVRVEDALRIPLLQPAIRDGKYYRLRDIASS